MKNPLFRILAFVLLLPLGCWGETFTLLVENTTGIVKGPFTHGPEPSASQHVVTPTTEQLAALNALRAAHPGARIVAVGYTFQVHPTDVLRAALVAEFVQLSPGEQILYRDAFRGVRDMLDADNLVEARKIIFLSPVPTEQLAGARERMLALFPQ